MSNLNIIHAIIQRGGIEDPVLRDSLIELAKELDRLRILVDPAPFIQSKYNIALSDAPLPVVVFEYEFHSTNITLSWEAPQTGFLLYEIKKGNSWNTATRVLITSSLSITIDPILVGTTTYLIKSLTSDGIYSLESTLLDIIVPPIGQLNLTAETLDSNVLLYWTIPETTFNIAYYIVKRDGVEVARINATFTHIKELAGGTFIYEVTPVDIAGNLGPAVSLQLLVAPPPDFVLLDEFITDFTLGTKVNSIVQTETTRLLASINLTETFQEHFDTRSWASPQAQIDAGYPIYIQPVPTTASYKEIFDIGIILTNVIVTLSWSYEFITGTFNLGALTRVSDDGISWTSTQPGQTSFWTSARYIEVTIDFTGSNDKALFEFYNFQVSVSIKEEMDGGIITADETDVNGTVVTFNKDFKDITDITIAVISATTVSAFVIFADIPNPPSFKVKAHDNAGVRTTADVRWDARGII